MTTCIACFRCVGFATLEAPYSDDRKVRQSHSAEMAVHKKMGLISAAVRLSLFFEIAAVPSPVT